MYDEANAARALESGLHRQNATGSLRRYLDALWWSSTPKDGIRVYHRNVYIFDRGVLVTILPLPQRYHQSADRQEAARRKQNKRIDGK